MKKGIHPEYQLAMVHCACGNNFETRATVGKINVENVENILFAICTNGYSFHISLFENVENVELWRGI
mgnify:CR=1 FL=1